MNTGLEHTGSTALCRRCGHLHWNEGDVCAECIREANVGNRIVCGLVIWTGLCIALGVIFATSCAGAEFPVTQSRDLNRTQPKDTHEKLTEPTTLRGESASPARAAARDPEASTGGRTVRLPEALRASISRSGAESTRPVPGVIRASGRAVAAPLLQSLAQPLRESIVTPTLLDAIAWRESRNNPRAVGKAGELGAWQIKAIAVREVNRIHGTRYRHADAVAQGREIARRYLIIVERDLTRTLKRNPTAEELYRGYRFGPTGFRKGQR